MPDAPPPAEPRPAFPWWVVLGGLVLALGYLPTLTAPFDFIDDGNLVYPAPPGTTLSQHVGLWWDKVRANVEHLGPFRPVLWAHWELAANALGGDPLAWRAVRLAWCALAAMALLWLMRELKVHPAAALAAGAAAMWNPYRNEIWTSLTLAEGVAMPYALLALVAARKAGTSSRPWAWDAAAVLGLLAALGCKNTFAALTPAMVALRLWPNGVSIRDGLRRNWLRATAYLVPLALPAAHFAYFKLNWHPGQYETPGPTLAQAGRLASWLKGAAGLDFLAAGLALALVALWRARGRPSPPAAAGGLASEFRAALLCGALLLFAGFAVYLPLPMVAARYTMPAVWGSDVLLGVLLTALTTVPPSLSKRVAWAGIGLGVAALLVANVGRQEKVAARSRMLWAALEYVERAAPPGARLAWVSGDSTAGALNAEEGIHFRWHLLNRGRGDIHVGLFDEAGNPIERVELPPLDGEPIYRLAGAPTDALGRWEPGPTFAAPYRLGRKQFACRLDVRAEDRQSLTPGP
jgi:hypothetical protein